MLKCLRRILEMRGSAGLYVTTNGTTSFETLGLVCNALVREILAAVGTVLLGNYYYYYYYYYIIIFLL